MYIYIYIYIYLFFSKFYSILDHIFVICTYKYIK